MNTNADDINNAEKPGHVVIDIDSRASTVVHTPTNTAENSPPTRDPNIEINDTITSTLESYPCGYPQLAGFQSSESSFSIYRTFDYLHSRVILQLQDELRDCEENLSDMDYLDSKNGREKCLTSRMGDLKQTRKDKQSSSKRVDLLATIATKLIQYDQVLVGARKLGAFQRPSARDYRSVRRFFYNEKPLSSMSEEQYILRKEDLVTLRHGREWATFDGWVEGLVSKFPWKWLTRKLFTTPELRKKSTSDTIFYYSPSRIEQFVCLIITFIIFVLLVLPVVAMYKLTYVGNRNNLFDAIGILVAFTLLFSAAMGMLTKAKRHELFAASAAYCAVLVVFISNFDGQNGKMGSPGG
ncbi:hypothetical protein P154DRAFT_618706 [Amniculicola lignicola CBS 123094]|uniref:DUF6594 domain-containing protein n=1 Tax=Amniculicola lignicola CBS 123094 TaxID=1392246 RepID=A0A6A5WQ34_9PLEO|nr:hypothetical protein P154DRAFT_618706 [Amniculicola lignicola CBS 123094]